MLIDDQRVFGCYDTIAQTIYHSELGSSAAILRAGYNIDSFMVCSRFMTCPENTSLLRHMLACEQYVLQ